MSEQILSTRQRLMNAALELFSTQGVTETTTRQIAELAKVNEVTLFRHFGNKQGLLLAVVSESAMFKNLGESLRNKASQIGSFEQAIKEYASDRLQALEQVPDLVLSVVGEARRYPVENRQVIGTYLTEANHDVAEYIATVMEREHLSSQIPAQKLASLLNSLLLGYGVIQLATEFHTLWQDRNEFLEDLVKLFSNNVTSADPSRNQAPSRTQAQPGYEAGGVRDLPANLVHLILARAKKSGLRDYALMYILFGAGLSPAEIANLERSHQIIDPNQHLLQIAQNPIRQVPVNQWILGKRYGSYTRNPLTQWLKSRKDNFSALFLNDAGMPISKLEIEEIWQLLTDKLLTPEAQVPVIEQAQQTWCIEMLIRGMGLENLSLLTGWDLAKLQPYARRAKEKLALEQAISLDRKSQ